MSYLLMGLIGFSPASKGSFSINGIDFLADGSNYVAVATLQNDFVTALDPLLNGRIQTQISGGNEQKFTPAVPTTSYSNDSRSRANQRGIFVYLDISNNITYRQTIPFIDDDQFTPITDPITGNTNLQIPPASANFVAMKAAWDAYYLREGNATTLEAIILSQ